ncbi:hypothetical protein BO82DRAFT_397269 [Aspergillus uvarum CBS 121591]|uniref:DUF6604 domain-containing protein n=1 Tax=Aspergillus uvarum CBS 121591 TaxID=1448315 RepID=A0A319CMQ9_9EURO|nr:hypothetical protein BO82DRAFT_397269 [Aspergillus uvarum CBS 121591]PYH86685.1 hypothetical protein BO82DRAFT_397269 [Aspergillus uvarum CBS 121591]
MSVPTHISQYTQYKQDTNDVAAWLLTAHPDFKQPKGPGRLKGRARRAAREDAEAGSTAPPQDPKEYTLTLKEFVERATKIVATQHVKAVPRLVAIKLRRSIVRRRYQQRYYEHGDGDADSNASHAHFTSVLEDVEKVLMPLLPKEFQKKARQGADEDDAEAAALINRFEALKVEEVANEAPDSHAAADSTEASPTVAVNCKIAEEEVNTPSPIFALELLLEDLWMVTHHVRESWQMYREGRMSLEAASVATETAHHLFYNTECEIRGAGGIDDCPGGWPSAMYKIYMARQKAQEQGETQGESSGFFQFLEDLMNIWEALLVLLDERRSLAISDLLHVQLPTCDWARDDRHLLQRLLLDEAIVQNRIFSATPQVDSLPGVDQFGLYLYHACEDSAVSLTTLYLTVFYLEMRLTMGSESGKAWPELRTFLETTTPEVIQAAQRYGYLSSRGGMSSKVLECQNGWLEQAEIVTDDSGADSPLISARSTSQDRAPSHRRIPWFSSNPWLCGRLLIIYKTLAYELGLYWSNCAPTPLVVCHLYNAAKKEKALPDGWSWPGVESLLDTYPEMFFSHQRPRAWSNYSQSVMKALGGGIETVRREGRRYAGRNARRAARADPGRHSVNLTKIWQFPQRIFTLAEIKSRWFKGKDEWTADEITRILQESLLCRKFVKSTIRRGAEPKLSMVDALRRLRKCINVELAVLNDETWIQYHNLSWDICTRIGTEITAVREDALELGYTEEHNFLIVHTLFETKDQKLLQEAARIMQAVVSEV